MTRKWTPYANLLLGACTATPGRYLRHRSGCVVTNQDYFCVPVKPPVATHLGCIYNNVVNRLLIIYCTHPNCSSSFASQLKQYLRLRTDPSTVLASMIGRLVAQSSLLRQLTVASPNIRTFASQSQSSGEAPSNLMTCSIPLPPTVDLPPFSCTPCPKHFVHTISVCLHAYK